MAKRNLNYDIVLDVVPPEKKDDRGLLRPVNRDPYFHPLNKSLRAEKVQLGIWSDRPNSALNEVGGSIPGQRLMVDMNQRHVKIIDRMTLPENQHKDRVLREIARREKYWHAAFDRYLPDEDHGIPEEDWPTWLYFIRRMVDHGRLRVVQGESKLPHLHEILAMCDHKRKIVIQCGESGGMQPKDQNEPFYQLDERHADKFRPPETATASKS